MSLTQNPSLAQAAYNEALLPDVSRHWAPSRACYRVPYTIVNRGGAVAPLGEQQLNVPEKKSRVVL